MTTRLWILIASELGPTINGFVFKSKFHATRSQFHNSIPRCCSQRLYFTNAFATLIPAKMIRSTQIARLDGMFFKPVQYFLRLTILGLILVASIDDEQVMTSGVFSQKGTYAKYSLSPNLQISKAKSNNYYDASIEIPNHKPVLKATNTSFSKLITSQK